ncbi:MAG: hypothetical protein ABIQ72_16415 [Usitatibacter sp.]
MSQPQRPQIPPALMEALKGGNKLEALKLLREAAKSGKVDPKSMVEALAGVKVAAGQARGLRTGDVIRHHHSSLHEYRARPGLSPGEEPDAGGSSWWVLVFLGFGVFIYALLG